MTAFGQQLCDVARQLARPSGRAAWRADLAMVPRAIRWALPWAVLGRVSRDASPTRWLERWAQKRPQALAVVDSSRSLTYAALLDETSKIASVLSARGVTAKDRVAVLLPTGSELVAAILGCWTIGAQPSPLDPNSPPSLLRDVLRRLEPKWLIGSLPAGVDGDFDVITLQDSADVLGADPTASAVAVALPAAQVALILPTSGSEGIAKLCRITAGRLAFSGHAFGGLALRCRPGDVIFCPLPLHHATAVTVAWMSALVHGVTLHLPGKFSASRFAQDLLAARATQLVYVGDLLRQVLANSVGPIDATLRLRVAVGNGLDEATWQTLLRRQPQLRIVEFYGATEAPTALLNFSGKLGSIGRVPFRSSSRFVLVRSADGAADASAGGATGVGPDASADASAAARFSQCGPGEIGELWIRLPRRRRPWLGDFEGYLAPQDEHRAIIESAFRPGERHYRTHDLMRYDRDDYLYFVDRLGDVWRSKGHNVSTLWLAKLLREVPGVEDACVVPVALDDSSRRFGLAVVTTPQGEPRDALINELGALFRSLPPYAQPHLLQLVDELPHTSNWKVSKGAWRTKSWEPSPDAQATYVWPQGPRHDLDRRATAPKLPELRPCAADSPAQPSPIGFTARPAQSQELQALEAGAWPTWQARLLGR